MTKILVIEDELAIRNNIVEMLELEDFEAIEAPNGFSGLQKAIAETPDLILCDIMMPELDGYGVLEKLRQHPNTSNIPFIFLTALADRKDNRKAMELGADDYITKPCTPEELINAINIRLEKQAKLTQTYTNALKQASEKLEYLIHYDSVTKLPNRLLLREKFQDIVNHGEIIPVLYISLDRFKLIQETLGNTTSDSILSSVADRLTRAIGKDGIIASLNTEEFAIISTKQIHQKIEAINLAETILKSLAQAFIIDEGDQEVFLTASIGIAMYPRDERDIEKLLLNASKAMEQSQQKGGNQYQFYTPTLNVGFNDRLMLETDLRYALERNELEIYYQPKVSLKTGKIAGAEALLRWHHSQRGIINPGKFIPIAEETGLILPIGEWILKTACLQTLSWHQAGFGDLQIAVNLSGRQFNQMDMRQRLVQILIETNFPAQYLELELTESILVENCEMAIRRLNGLKMLGVQIAIDDFGTGYSSLRYLQQFPFDILKIDRCFINEINRDRKTKAITKAIIDMAHGLDLYVIAEGVETEAELDFLQEQKCDEIQGYFFSRPLPASDFEQLLLAEKKLY